MQKKIILVFPMLCLFFIYLELSPTKIKKIKYFDKETEITVMDNRLKVPKAIYNIQTDPFSGTPEQIANQYLKKNFIKHKLKSDLSDLNLIKVKKSLSGSQVIFSQSYQNIPVIGGNVLLNLNKRKCVTALISGYKPDICINTTPSVSYLTAEQSLRDNLNIDKSESGLLKKSNLNIYLGDDNEYHLIWRVVLKIKNPSNEIWYAYIDASDGQLLKKIQANQYALNCGADKQMATTTSGQVCDPDPETAEVSTLAQAYVYRDIKDVEVFTATPDYPNDYDK